MTFPIPSRPLGRLSAAALLACVLAGAVRADEADTAGLDPLDPLLQPARTQPHAQAAVLIAITRAGDRLVAAGESGIVLTSDDDGRSWRQAEVPVRVTLTAVHFPTPERGWAVGHSGVVLTSGDGGASWSRQLDGRRIAELPVEPRDPSQAEGGLDAPPPEPAAGDPLLGVLFLDEREGFAVGAFGLVLHTTDGGAHWRRASARLPNPDGNHLYGIERIGDRLYVAGERGAAFVSHDRGAHFQTLTTPYQGSFFGVAADPAQVVVFGLEGCAFASTSPDAANWRDVGGSAGAAWTGAAALGDGRVALVGQAGAVALVSANGAVEPLPVEAPPLSAVARARGGDLVAVGPRGVHVIATTAAPRAGAAP